MLTVKHIAPSGCESLYSAVEVRYDPGKGPESIASAPTLWIDTPSASRGLVGGVETRGLGSWGTFYVMNDAGKTVARYDLGGWNEPSVAGDFTTRPPGDLMSANLSTGELRAA